MNSISKAIILVACAILSSALVGCNTVKGAGKDVERGGEKIQGAAEGAKNH